MNRTKRELYEENKCLKNREREINDWLYDNDKDLTIDKIIKISKDITKVKNVVLIISVILLCLSCLFLGLGWK